MKLLMFFKWFRTPKSGSKSKGLQKYISEENKKGENLFGGIVVPKGGSFWTYNKIPYKWDKDLKGWEILAMSNEQWENEQ